MNVLALIPARSGSKSIPHKNIRKICGKHLIGWSIEHAIKARRVDRVVVSTDSLKYAEIARKYGAETPFIRPPAFAGDESTDLEVFIHALEWLTKTEEYSPDICVHLRPTYPVRKIEMIDHMIDWLIKHPDWDSVRTVTLAEHTPYKMWKRDEDGLLSPLLKMKEIPEPWNEPRQKLPDVYMQTGNIDVVWTRVLFQQCSMTGSRIQGYIDDDFLDIDTEKDFKKVFNIMTRREANIK